MTHSAFVVNQSNAEFERERIIQRRVESLLQGAKFPLDRIWVDLRFDWLMLEHSASAYELYRVAGEVHGVVRITFNGLFLMQDMEAMASEVVPHELAHVLQAVAAKERDEVVAKPHDEAWMEFFYGLAPDQDAAAKVKGSFDTRAIRLAKGGIAALCECGGDEAWDVFSSNPASQSKLKNGEQECKLCGCAYVIQDSGALPESIRNEIRVLEFIKCNKQHHTILRR